MQTQQPAYERPSWSRHPAGFRPIQILARAEAAHSGQSTRPEENASPAHRTCCPHVETPSLPAKENVAELNVYASDTDRCRLASGKENTGRAQRERNMREVEAGFHRRRAAKCVSARRALAELRRRRARLPPDLSAARAPQLGTRLDHLRRMLRSRASADLEMLWAAQSARSPSACARADFHPRTSRMGRLCRLGERERQ